MPESAPNQVRRERHRTLVAACIVCLALPTVAVLVCDRADESARRANVYWLIGTAIAAAILPFFYWAPYRALGFVPLAALGWFAAVGHGVYWNEWPAWAHGVPLGLIVGALVRGRRGPEPWPETALLFSAVLIGVGIAWMFVSRGRPFEVAGWFLIIASVALVGWSWARFFRPLFELSIEPVMWLMYRVRRAGPGFASFPRTGPCIVIANHACWLDPLFLAKVLPRPITPMMTAKFFDLPVMRQLVVGFGVIRVPEKAVKKDAPEIQDAVAALDRGECVVIFPEGYLRRSDDKPLKRFGQGVWHLLKARPDTPVFAVWIEGAWGSYTSYFTGAPTKNKKRDFRRPIGIGMSEAESLPPELLTAHLPTRIHLMNLVSAARARLGLEPLSTFTLPEKSEEIAGEVN